jgi:hypothetical protein
VKVPDTPSGAPVAGKVRQHKGEIQGVLVVVGQPLEPPLAHAVVAVQVKRAPKRLKYVLRKRVQPST